MVSADLIAYLLPLAAKLSGYPVIDAAQLPPIRSLPAAEISREICPGDASGCNGMVAIFDTDRYQILIRDNLDLDNPADNSFLLHELVHVLQFKAKGDDIFADCPTTMRTETEAYRVQNTYLGLEGQFLRVGDALAFMTCAGKQDTFFTRDVMIEPAFKK
ncbi:MAG: hypothetical protein EBS54_05315 [Betaproteobacteria bacterium]|jgi:hypothetical protein|nr:hypothetical protein [Betaproteobacteria bacterium]NBR98511.1 hypothetical protein [Betaproteobacteria bacterium]NBS93723.1 hypothetical protein [Betaproteobacteria bacterium]NBT06158.1 hypothetical protein [Betaproteobacteria bacterium]NBY53688.1 hypothetical protein [Betaproteobacteria bacterium]